MSFANWKKRSEIFCTLGARTGQWAALDRVCAAAYKAGERDGRKQTEGVSERAIMMRKIINGEWPK